MAKMGTPLVKVFATRPHPYYKESTEDIVIVVNTDGEILYKKAYKAFRSEEYHAERGGTYERIFSAKVKPDILAEWKEDPQKAIKWLKGGLGEKEGYVFHIPETAQKEPEPQFGSLREKIAWDTEQREKRYAGFAELVRKAHEAGMAAANAHKPTPMVVVEHANPLNDNSPVVRRYDPVMSGVCGFAWVKVYPGNCSFAKWAVKNDGWRSAYKSGVQLNVRHFGQSMELKEQYAQAYSKVLQEAGIRAYSESRMD